MEVKSGSAVDWPMSNQPGMVRRESEKSACDTSAPVYVLGIAAGCHY